VHVDVDSLRRHYALLDTCQLMHLQQQGALREDAAAVLVAELACRDDDVAEHEAIRQQLELVRGIAAQASPERRLFARLLDLLLLVPPALVVFVLLLKTGLEPTQSAWALLATATPLYWALDALFGGVSPGKWACGIRVVAADDHEARPGRNALLARNLLPALASMPTVIFFHWMDMPQGLPVGLLAFSLIAIETNRWQTDRRFGDRIAGTIVVCGAGGPRRFT
jgi:uncharacterized RDD family membrane protein YckC